MIDYLFTDAGRTQLQVECEFGTGSIALVRCCGRLDVSSLPQLLAVIHSAFDQEYHTLIFDFTYSSYEEASLSTLFTRLAGRGMTALTLNTIGRLAETWNCALPDVFVRLGLTPQPSAELPANGRKSPAISKIVAREVPLQEEAN